MPHLPAGTRRDGPRTPGAPALAALGHPRHRHLGHTDAGRGPDRPFPELTEREHEILDAVAAGLTNTQIGHRLYLAPKTVANNVTAILDKLHVAHRAEAIIRACDAGLGREQ